MQTDIAIEDPLAAIEDPLARSTERGQSMTPPGPMTTELGRRGRLSRRLLAWFLVFSLLPLLVTNAIGYRRSEGIITRLVERYLGAIAQIQAQHVRDRTCLLYT